MKKVSIVTAIVLMLVMLFTACGSSGNKPTTPSNGDASTGFTFTKDGVVVEMGSDAQEAVAKLGKETSYFESESCAFEGLDKVYTYPGFKLNTYPVEGKDYVLSIVFTDDTVATDKGITVGSEKASVIEAYGEPAEQTDTKLVYKEGKTELTIGLDGESVKTVQIGAVVVK